ncbi:hypothetical protein APHAL10511_006173 [Amanita phalloides]|nr:hypothetical protein APHAL10511_006173 [Amanita phalloides]
MRSSLSCALIFKRDGRESYLAIPLPDERTVGNGTLKPRAHSPRASPYSLPSQQARDVKPQSLNFPHPATCQTHIPFGSEVRRRMPSIAASMAACCTHPLDLTKVRMQTLSSSSGRSRLSMLSVLRASIAQSGFRSLYTGLSASLMRQMSYSLVRIGVYEKLKAKISENGKPPILHLLLAASFAGGLGGIAGNPTDIILVRMTSDSVRPPEGRYNYRNAVIGLMRLVKEESLKGLTRGLGTNMSRAVLMNASQVGSYDFFKSTLLNRQLPVVNYQFRDNLVLHVVSSCLSGTFATTICSPADVIRSRLMASSSKTTFINVLIQSLREEGPRFLFKGWTPAFIRLGPNTVLLFVFFEQLKAAWKNSTQR